MERKNTMDDQIKVSTAHDHGDHKEEFDELWKLSEKNSVLMGLREVLGGRRVFQDLIEGIKDLKKVFDKAAKKWGCSDGRIHEHRCGRAGEGIVCGIEASLDAIEEKIKRGEIKDKYDIESHDGCGGAKKVCDMKKAAGELPQDYDSDKLGFEFAEALMKAAAERFPEITFTHTHRKASEMDVLHGERVIYYDGTGKINLEVSDQLPDGFVFSALNNDEKAGVELAALCEIALGDHHGFGERFTAENPFWIIISAKDEEQEKIQKEIAKKVADKFDGRVSVESFVMKQ